jgi:hypothetical protein
MARDWACLVSGQSTSAGWSALRVAIGVALILVAAWGGRALAQGSARLAKATLGG